MKHKHADLIHAWADGAVIQYKTGGLWVDCINNSARWLECCEYRIKPEEKKPVVRWLWADETGTTIYAAFSDVVPCGGRYPIKLEWSRTEFPE